MPKVPISFKDLAVRFSEEEWRLLQEGQREFYRDVMRENYETLVSVGTSELLPLSAFLSPTEPGGATAGESHHDKGQEPPLDRGSQGGQPQQSLHLTALVQLVKEIPEFLFGEVKGTEDHSDSGCACLDGERASPAVAGAVETYPPRGLLSSLPESPASHPSLATTPTSSSSSSGPPGDWAQESPLPTIGTADKPLSIEKEGLGETSIHPTQSLDQSKSYLRQDRSDPGTGTSPENSPLQGLINCLKEILVPGPQHHGTATDLPASLPGLSVLKQSRAEVEPGSLPCPVKTEAISGDCPLQGLLNCLKEIPEAPDRRPSPSGAGDLQLQEDPGKRNSGGMRRPQTPPLRRSHGAGSMLAVVKVEDGWVQSPPVPAPCQLSRQGHGPYFTGDSREVRVPRWGPMTLAGRASSSPLEALEACLKGIPPGRSSPLQPLATSWSRSPQPGDAGSQRLEPQPQGSHSTDASREPLLPLSLRGYMREGPGIQSSGSQGTPTSFSSASSSDGDLDFRSPRSSQGQRLGKGYLPGNSPLQGLENCLREIPIPRPQAAWPCSLAADRGSKRTEPRSWTADTEGPRAEACEPPHLRQGRGEVPSRSLHSLHQVTARPGPWQWPKDETATMPSPLHCLESSLRGILPVRPLRFACVTGPDPSPSPCSSSSFSSSDGEDLRPEPAFWQPPLQKKDHLPSSKGPVPLCPVPGTFPGVNNSCLAEEPDRSESRDCSSPNTGRAEGTGVKSQSPRREGATEHTCQPGPVSSAEGKGGVLDALSAEAAGCPWPASQLEERPEPKGAEDTSDLEPGHGQPSATARTQGKLLSGDPLEPPSNSPLPTTVLSKWPPTSFQTPCPCGRFLQQELHSLGTALTDKLDQLAAALAGLTQEVATMRTQMDQLGRRPQSLGPKGQASWRLTLPRRPRWANRLDHRHLPYWRQKGPTRPRPKILRAQAEGCKAGDRPGLSRGKGNLVPQLPPDGSLVESSRPTGSSSQQISSAPGGHTVLTAHPLLEHTGCHQNPPSPSVPTALVPLVASPATSADTEPQAAGGAAISIPNQHKEPNSLLGGALSKDLWGGDHRDPRWGAH
ncbi:protein KRBA1 isoform X4 [Onychomys torridus]|uniref:protein KRBA1 isoform X4 n=1 Tax=Onychomys torridus TaxID=38674 RepID=UPI00167F8956|nr:protein KRBA1 isoform X4 [Onychomys torridus]XP_036038811.1 protein KRBA1 isoform X4 [Onychomys torridus]XP_036038812.1 protein KRBA1 isoform X4 [Onychomys torridus]